MAYKINDKKKTLLAQKEEILRDIKYFEKRIEEARSQKTNSSYFDDDNDSDSDSGFSLDMGPSIPDLKLEESRLRTCLHATQELTSLIVLQSEVNIILNDPVYERGLPVTDPGTWREVTADCRVDLVPFSITFYAHQPSRLFGPISYRGLRVLPVKAAHENELTRSILSHVDTPSDAVEVLRSYAIAHRSRRTTLARLAEKYSNFLFMEPMANGGYILKCAKLLEVSWTLENKWSPIAAFHHKMKFDLEYMDEAYVKIISQAHRELSDPTLETEERTRLMSKIIATCLEVQGPTQELYESMESDIEPENGRKRPNTLDKEIDEPTNKKKKDSEIMAPPKSLPKKPKLKGKENNVDNNRDLKAIKRSAMNEGENGVKKAKRHQDNTATNSTVNTKDKTDNVKEIKTAENEIVKSISATKKTIVNKKKSDQDNVGKNVVGNTKQNADKETIVTSKNTLNNVPGDVKNNVAISKGGKTLGSTKNSDVNIKKATDDLREDRNSTASKKRVDKQTLNTEFTNDKMTTAKENSDNLINTKKYSKLQDVVLNNNKAQSSNKIVNKATLKKVSKTVQESNNGATKKITSIKEQTTQSNSGAKIEKVQKNKVSSKKDMVGKDEHLNVIDKNSNKNTKSKSTDNATEIVVRKVMMFDNNPENKTNNAIHGKPIKQPIPLNIAESNSGNINKKNNPLLNDNTKNVKSNVKIVTTKLNEGKMKSKSNENSNDNVMNMNTKSSRKEDMAKDNLLTNLNKQISENTKRLTTQNTVNNILEDKNKKSRDIEDGLGDKREPAKSSTNSKHNGTQLKVIVKNMKAKTKTRTGSDKKYVDINLDIVNEQVPADVNEKNLVEIIENIANKKNNPNKQILHGNENNDNRKLSKPKLNVKNNAQSIKAITNNRNLKHSKSPIQKNNIKFLNHRNNALTNNKEKENNTQKDNINKNKILTKIPQKLLTVREHFIKKNPLRISPRKTQSNLKTDSQNSSRSSLRSIQKPMTGIPRLMKKPVLK